MNHNDTMDLLYHIILYFKSWKCIHRKFPLCAQYKHSNISFSNITSEKILIDSFLTVCNEAWTYLFTSFWKLYTASRLPTWILFRLRASLCEICRTRNYYKVVWLWWAGDLFWVHWLPSFYVRWDSADPCDAITEQSWHDDGWVFLWICHFAD